MDMMNGMALIDDQSNFFRKSFMIDLLISLFGFDITKGPYLYRIIPDGINYLFYIFGRAQVSIFSFQDGTDHPAGMVTARGFILVQSVIYQDGHADIFRIQRHVIARPHNGTGAIAFIKPEPGYIFFEDIRG